MNNITIPIKKIAEDKEASEALITACMVTKKTPENAMIDALRVFGGFRITPAKPSPTDKKAS